jgi:dTDP-4-dehydrorhamnose reductase
MTARILVTGAAGLLGSQILKQVPSDVIVVATRFQQALPIDFVGEVHQIDLSNAPSVTKFFAEQQFDAVINCAGASNVDRCERDKAYAQQGNLAVVRNLVESAHRNTFRLITFSSDYIFNGESGPYSEFDEPNPINYYGQSKLMAEEIVSSHEINSCILRVCSLYSTDPAAPKNIYGIMRDSLAAGKVYRAASDLYSNPTEVSDLASAVWQLLTLPKFPRLLHLAAPDNFSRVEFARQVARRIGADQSLVESQSVDSLGLPARRPKKAGLRSDLAYSLLGRRLKSPAEILPG